MNPADLARLQAAAGRLALPYTDRARLVACAARRPTDPDWGEGPACWLAEAELERLQARRRWDPADPLHIDAAVLLDVRDDSAHLVCRVVRSRPGPLLIALWWGPRQLKARQAHQRRLHSGPPPLWEAGVLADLPLLDPGDPAMHAPLEPTCDSGRCGRFVLDPGKVRAAIPLRSTRRTVTVGSVLG